MTHFSWVTILLLVTAHPTRGLYTDLSREAVLVTVTDFGAQTLETPLTLGAVCVDLALGVTQTISALVTRGTLTWGGIFICRFVADTMLVEPRKNKRREKLELHNLNL